MNPFACKSIFLHTMCICVTCYCAVISAFVLLCILKTCFAATHTHRAVQHFFAREDFKWFCNFARVCKSFLAMKDFLQQTLQQIWVFRQLVWQQRQSQSICNRFLTKTKAVHILRNFIFQEFVFAGICIQISRPVASGIVFLNQTRTVCSCSSATHHSNWFLRYQTLQKKQWPMGQTCSLLMFLDHLAPKAPKMPELVCKPVVAKPQFLCQEQA